MKGRKKFIWDDEAMEKVKQLAASGLNYRQIANSVGCSYETLRVAKNTNRSKGNGAALSAAIEAGRAQGQATVGAALYRKAIGGNVQAMIYYLEKCGFMDREEESELKPASFTVNMKLAVDNTKKLAEKENIIA